MDKRRNRIADEELHHYEDNIAVFNRVMGALERLFHMVTLHIMDADVRAVAQEDIRDAYESTYTARKRSIERMNSRKLEAKRRKREKRERRDARYD
jgi:hypothetical protein